MGRPLYNSQKVHRRFLIACFIPPTLRVLPKKYTQGLQESARYELWSLIVFGLLPGLLWIFDLAVKKEKLVLSEMSNCATSWSNMETNMADALPVSHTTANLTCQGGWPGRASSLL